MPRVTPSTTKGHQTGANMSRRGGFPELWRAASNGGGSERFTLRLVGPISGESIKATVRR